MLLRHNPDERQSQTDPARVVRARMQGASEALEQLGLLLGCDAMTGDTTSAPTKALNTGLVAGFFS